PREAIDAGMDSEGECERVQDEREGHVAPIVEGDGTQESTVEDTAARGRLAGERNWHDLPSLYEEEAFADEDSARRGQVGAKEDVTPVADRIALEVVGESTAAWSQIPKKGQRRESITRRLRLYIARYAAH